MEEPLLARLDPAYDEVDGYTNSIKIVMHLTQNLQKLVDLVISEMFGLADQFALGTAKWSMSADRLGSAFLI